ncbi:histidine kinase, partial [Actinomadura sp. KC345]
MSRLRDTRLGRALRLPPRGRHADALVAAGCLLVSVLSVLPEEGDARARQPEAAWSLLVVACLALYFRRRRPVVVAAVTLVACGLYYPLTEPDGLVIITLAVALYTAAAEGHLAAAAAVAAAALAATAYGNRGDASHLEDAAGVLLVGWFVAVIAIGAVVRNRRAYLREADERARVAERGRELEARRRAIEERLRIARELHDVLGHNISLINVQATAALHGLRREPERAEDALTAIKQASKDTLREMRATLGVLRQVDEAAPVAPA